MLFPLPAFLVYVERVPERTFRSVEDQRTRVEVVRLGLIWVLGGGIGSKGTRRGRTHC